MGKWSSKIVIIGNLTFKTVPCKKNFLFCNYQAQYSRGSSTNSFVVNWLTELLSDPFPPDLQNIITHKPLEL